MHVSMNWSISISGDTVLNDSLATKLFLNMNDGVPLVVVYIEASFTIITLRPQKM